MKKIFSTLGITFIVIINSFSQNNNSKLALEVRYPMPQGDNFINRAFGTGYSGEFDFGLDYTFYNNSNFKYGLILYSSYLNLKVGDVDLNIISPKVKFEYDINITKVSIIPQLSVGYSFLRFKAPLVDQFGNLIPSIVYKENHEGLSIKAATKLLFFNHKNLNFYVSISYEFTKLREKDTFDNIKYNRNVELIYPGLGIQWKFKK